MSQHRHTIFADRDNFIRLHQAHNTYGQIAQICGWKPVTIAKHCRAFAQQGAAALPPKRLGRTPRGCLSTFAPVVRLAALRVKREHPAWGPAVIRDELQQRPSTGRLPLPHVAQLAAYFQQFGGRLVQPRRHLQLPPALAPEIRQAARLIYQMDMQERQHLPHLGYFNVLNLRAPMWGLTHSYPHPAGIKHWQCKVSQSEAREDCRTTFERWGLPDELQTDHDTVLVSLGDYPFPSWFTLWLVGLGISHRLIERVIQNGSVERSHRTFDKQMLSGMEACPDWNTFLTHVAHEEHRLNERLPSRAKACRGQVPVVAHPEALKPRRPYRRDDEGELFDLRRVDAYLAGGRWLRQVTFKGQFKFADRMWLAGLSWAHQTIVLTFEPDKREFIVRSPTGQELNRLPGNWITAATIRGIESS